MLPMLTSTWEVDQARRIITLIMRQLDADGLDYDHELPIGGMIEVPAAAPVTLDIYDGRGRLVRRLVDETLPAGLHRPVWRGLDQRGQRVASGVYYVSVPRKSGELILSQGAAVTRITPREGMLVLFPPHVVHEVSVNLSGAMRLSIGMNFGVREADGGSE